MCICTYYSLFKIGMLTFYSLTPSQTRSVSLLMICSMVARYAPPISYNFLNLIRLPRDARTIFERRMGKIDDAVPFFGRGFNKIYLLIMVIYTIMVGSNFFDRVVNYFGNWKLFQLQSEADNLDGFDQSGLMILHKERSSLEKGHTVGELVIPLARNFNNSSMDIESGSSSAGAFESKATTSLIEDGNRGYSRPPKAEVHDDSSQEHISRKYSSTRPDRSRKDINSNSTGKNMASFTASSHDASDRQSMAIGQPSRLASTWESMKSGFQNFKSNVEAKKFLPLRQIQHTQLSQGSSSESLDDIFERLKRPTPDHRKNGGADDLDD